MLSALIPMDNLISFAIHFAVAIVMLAIFAGLWLKATPFDDIGLIRQGNAASAISFAGALIGFAIPVAGVVRASTSIWEVLPWSAIALIAQLLGLWAATRIMHGLVKPIERGETAAGIFVAGIAITIGILNAACMGG
jgi:putative membrane protein